MSLNKNYTARHDRNRFGSKIKIDGVITEGGQILRTIYIISCFGY
jgi:hypothetical protein